MSLLVDLKKPLQIENMNFRIGRVTKKKDKATALAYLDARDVMQRLDEVFGVGGWQCKYPFKGCCELSVKIDGEWITKSNGAGESAIEAEKGQYSDSFKRAAVLLGIGQYLYDAPNNWYQINEWKQFTEAALVQIKKDFNAWQSLYFADLYEAKVDEPRYRQHIRNIEDAPESVALRVAFETAIKFANELRNAHYKEEFIRIKDAAKDRLTEPSEAA